MSALPPFPPDFVVTPGGWWPTDPEVLRQVLIAMHSGAQRFRFVSISVLTLLAYDYILTFPQELEVFMRMPRRLNLPTAIFFVNRYWSLVVAGVWSKALFTNNPTIDACMRVIPFGSWGSNVLVTLVNLSLVLRVVAFYERKRAIMWTCGIAFVAWWVTTMVSIQHVFALLTVLPKIQPGVPPACAPVGTRDMWAMSAPQLIFDALILVLTVARVRTLGREMRTTPIIAHIYSAGLGYFLVMYVVIFFVAFADRINPDLGVAVQPAIPAPLITSLLGSRMLLTMRTALRPCQPFTTIELNRIAEADSGAPTPRRGSGADSGLVYVKSFSTVTTATRNGSEATNATDSMAPEKLV